MSEALQRNSTLTSLDLGGNGVGDSGAERLAEALQRNSTLTSLDLRNNEVGDSGAEAMQQIYTLLHANTATRSRSSNGEELLLENITLA